MKYYTVHTIGCKVAQYESRQVRCLLESFGLVDRGADGPDLCVINTCAVTRVAASKSRRAIRTLVRRFPNARLAVLGCYASQADDTIRAIKQVVLLADHRQGVLSALHTFLQAQPTIAGNSLPTNSYANTDIETHPKQNVKHNFAHYAVDRFNGRHRAILKVQDGCNAGCTYCLIPSFRPHLSSAPMNAVLDQARRFIDAGHGEIVLSGVFLGAYGRTTTTKSRLGEPGEPLADLVDRLARLPGLGRLRLSSIEPGDLTPCLIDVMAAHPAVVNHLHLPLQSGSDRVLKRMGRQYRRAEYLDAIESATKRLSDLAVTTDIIVGFPGEADGDFQATLETAQAANFAKIHSFPFSPRPGSPAYAWRDDQPPQTVVKNRLTVLRNLEKTLAADFRQSFVGKTVRVLVEKVAENGENGLGPWCSGRADAYFPVGFCGATDLDGRLVSVRIDSVDRDTLAVAGTLAEAEQLTYGKTAHG